LGQACQPLLDTYTVEIQLERSFGPFLETVPTVSIVNPAVMKAHEENGD
jgi:hypothetical protein